MAEPLCRWCHETRAEHLPASQPNRPRMRMPCLGWQEHFVADPKAKLSNEACPRCRRPLDVCSARFGGAEQQLECRDLEIANLKAQNAVALLGLVRIRRQFSQLLDDVNLVPSEEADRG
jgi:hypothetical protein